MIRSLYTAASGMRVQQHKIDSIGNNIANVGTTGYKKSQPNFKENLYDTMEIRRNTEPVNLQVGNGVRIGSIQTHFRQGILEQTQNDLDVAIGGSGFFMVQDREGQPLYTRDGRFQISNMPGIGFRLENQEGYPVLNDQGRPIVFYNETRAEDIEIKDDGSIYVQYANVDSTYYGQLGIRTFTNPEGLNRGGGAYFYATETSGPPEPHYDSKILQRYLEFSNVDLAEEMTDMIMAQRAYQLNSRVMQTADEMEKLANNLRG